MNNSTVKTLQAISFSRLNFNRRACKTSQKRMTKQRA